MVFAKLQHTEKKQRQQHVKQTSEIKHGIHFMERYCICVFCQHSSN